MSPTRKLYVAGFLFHAGSVVMIRKNRPGWQAGKLNAPGGKVEPGETPLAAMRREFLQEAGVDIPEWEKFCVLEFNTPESGRVYFYKAKATPKQADAVTTVTDEQILWRELGTNLRPTFTRDEVIPNVHWLVPLALDKDNPAGIIVERVNV